MHIGDQGHSIPCFVSKLVMEQSKAFRIQVIHCKRPLLPNTAGSNGLVMHWFFILVVHPFRCYRRLHDTRETGCRYVSRELSLLSRLEKVRKDVHCHSAMLANLRNNDLREVLIDLTFAGSSL